MIFIFVLENFQNSFSWGLSVGPFWSAKHLNFGDKSYEIRILSRSIYETYMLRKVKILVLLFQSSLRTKAVWISWSISDKKNDRSYRSYVMIWNMTLHMSKQNSLEDEKRWKIFSISAGYFWNTYSLCTFIHFSFLSACLRIFYKSGYTQPYPLCFR